MGIFNIFKKNPKAKIAFEPVAKGAIKEKTTVKEYMKTHNVNSFNEPLDKLVDGDLPWGWTAHNKDFTDKISKEYSYFLQAWVDARNKSPKELYSALKSFVLYMEDVEKTCKEKGECFEFWFDEILTGKDYLKKRKQELENLSANLSESQNEYEQKQKLLSNLDVSLLNFLQSNDGILQKDVYKHFDPLIKSEIQSVLYEWDKAGKIKRVKSGNTYKIFTT